MTIDLLIVNTIIELVRGYEIVSLHAIGQDVFGEEHDVIIGVRTWRGSVSPLEDIERLEATVPVGTIIRYCPSTTSFEIIGFEEIPDND